MSNLEIILWPLVSVFVALVAIVTIDSNLERRRDRDTAADVLTREGRAAQRYEDLHTKYTSERDAISAERAELHIGRVRSTMYAEALIETNARLQADIAEIRAIMHRERITHRRRASSYEQFRIMIENTRKTPSDMGLSGANWRQIFEECNRWAIADMERHQESLENGS